MRSFSNKDVKDNFCDGKITVPMNFAAVDADAFDNCKNVTTIDFRAPLVFQYNCSVNGVFSDCDKLEKIIFRSKPNFSFGIFRNCPRPKVSVYVPDSCLSDVAREYKICKCFVDRCDTSLEFHSIKELSLDGGKGF